MDDQTRRESILRYHTPQYLLDMDCFVSNYRELDAAFSKEYDHFRIAYSFKTNYTPAICQKVNELGGYAEVVSELEYHMAKKYGFRPCDIIVNGPGKMSGIAEMLEDGALVMLDNREELDRAIQIAESLNRKVNIGFRLNFEIGSGKNSRFGFDVLSKETGKQIERARNSRNIMIRGIHFHLSGARSLQAWQLRAERMTELAEELLHPEERTVIDLGSGMFGHLDPVLAGQFDVPIPSFEEYVEAVAGVFKRKYGEREIKPQLVVEPGTTVVANAVEYITKVISVKTIRGRKIAIADGSVQQLGEIGKKKNLPIIILHESSTNERTGDAEISGYTCLEDDILYRCCTEPVGRGDYVILGNAGAYSNVLKPPFIQPGCKIVRYDSKRGLTLCKREETVEDILASYLY